MATEYQAELLEWLKRGVEAGRLEIRRVTNRAEVVAQIVVLTQDDTTGDAPAGPRKPGGDPRRARPL